MRKTGQYKPCTICGKLVWQKQCRITRTPFCSHECYAMWWSEHLPARKVGPDAHNWKGGKIERTCQLCSKTFFVCRNHVADSRKFCSLTCRSAYYSGERSPAWKGGITSEHNKAKMTPEYAEWRKAVYQRDHYHCVLCLTHPRILHAHHIKMFTEYPELRYDVANGATLCVFCHRKIAHCEHKFESLIRSRILRDFTSDTRVPLDIVKIKSELHGDMQRAAEMPAPCAA